MSVSQRLGRQVSRLCRQEVLQPLAQSSHASITTSASVQAGADSSDKQSADNRQSSQTEVPPMSPVGQNMEVPTEASPSERAEWVPDQVPKHKDGERFPDPLETDDTFANEERRGIKPPPELVPDGVKEGPTVVTENVKDT